jgi:hypothetical protein
LLGFFIDHFPEENGQIPIASGEIVCCNNHYVKAIKIICAASISMYKRIAPLAHWVFSFPSGK